MTSRQPFPAPTAQQPALLSLGAQHPRPLLVQTRPVAEFGDLSLRSHEDTKTRDQVQKTTYIGAKRHSRPAETLSAETPRAVMTTVVCKISAVVEGAEAPDARGNSCASGAKCHEFPSQVYRQRHETALFDL